jgi:hypothetical protein
MAREMVFLHWKAVRMGLVPFILAAFGLPLLAIQGTVLPVGMPSEAEGFYATFLLDAVSLWLPAFPALAAITGVTLALSAWNWDHQANHVYALSLPVSRARYALLKLGAGAVLALIPVTALLVGALIATAAVDLPSGLNAYPGALAVRFLFSTLLSYAVTFAAAAGTMRTTVIVLTASIGSLLVGDLVVDLIGAVTGSPAVQAWSFAGAVGDVLFAWPGPFHIFAGNWALIDV